MIQGFVSDFEEPMVEIEIKLSSEISKEVGAALLGRPLARVFGSSYLDPFSKGLT